jgi:arylsulfatase A
MDALMGKPGTTGRDHLIQQDNGSGNFGLRSGEWKLVRLKQRGKSQATVSIKEQAMPTGQHSLYRLTVDPGEQNDLSAEKPEIVQQMTKMLDQIIADGRSRQ